MMDNVPYITFDSSKYEDVEDMWYDVKDVVQILIKNNYQVAFRYEDCGIYMLEFSYDDASLGEPMIRWVDEEEFYDFLHYKECQCDSDDE